MYDARTPSSRVMRGTSLRDPGFDERAPDLVGRGSLGEVTGDTVGEVVGEAVGDAVGEAVDDAVGTPARARVA